jgi:hypothetical protein
VKNNPAKIGCFSLLTIFGIAIIAIIVLCIWGTTPAAKVEREKNAAASALAVVSEKTEIKRNAILDVSQFGGVSTDKLVKIMGKPSKVYKDKGDDADTYYNFSKSKYWCEFTIEDGKVIKLEMDSPKYYSNKGKDFVFHEDDDEANLKAFGVTEQYQPKITYTGLALNLTDGITDGIADMKFQLIGDNKKTFQILWVNYY